MSLPCMTEFISPQWESSHAAMTFWWDVPDSELIVTVVLFALARPNAGSAGRYGSADGKLRCFSQNPRQCSPVIMRRDPASDND